MTITTTSIEPYPGDPISIYDDELNIHAQGTVVGTVINADTGSTAIFVDLGDQTVRVIPTKIYPPVSVQDHVAMNYPTFQGSVKWWRRISEDKLFALTGAMTYGMSVVLLLVTVFIVGDH